MSCLFLVHFFLDFYLHFTLIPHFKKDFSLVGFLTPLLGPKSRRNDKVDVSTIFKIKLKYINIHNINKCLTVDVCLA